MTKSEIRLEGQAEGNEGVLWRGKRVLAKIGTRNAFFIFWRLKIDWEQRLCGGESFNLISTTSRTSHGH